jgi:hypothetical protein
MDLVAFKKTLRYARSAPPDEVARDVAELRGFDGFHEALERRWRRLTIFGFVGAFVSLFGVVFVGSQLGLPWLIAIPPALLVLGIAAAFRKRTWGRFNLANERYELLAAVCRLLKADLPRDGAVEAGLELGRVEDKRFLVREFERAHWKCKLYVQPWLRLRGRLVDGTRFDLRAVERQEVRTCWKTNARGKSKHKRKVKVSALLDVSLSPKGPAALAGLGDQVARAAKLPPGVRLVRARAEADSLGLRASLNLTDARTRFLDLERSIALMLLSLYQVVAGTRRGAP